MEYNQKVKRERLQVITDNVDFDGEGLRSDRRPKLIFYGCSQNDLDKEIPGLSTPVSNTSIFYELGVIILYRPSFIFDFKNNRILFNTATTRKVLETVAVSSGTCRFARILNAEREPSAVIQMTVGILNSLADIRVDSLRVDKDKPIKIVSNYIREP